MDGKIRDLLINLGFSYLSNKFKDEPEFARILSSFIPGLNETMLDSSVKVDIEGGYSDKDRALLEVKNTQGSVTLVLGKRNTGKSVLEYRIARFFERPTFCISPQSIPPSWITHIHTDAEGLWWVGNQGPFQKMDDILECIPENSTLIGDDLPAYFSNRSYNDELGKTIEKVIPMVRHPKQPPMFPLGKVHLIFGSQSSAQADKYILDCDLAFFKPLGLLYQDMERPGIRKIYKELVDPEFEGADIDFIHRHAYMLHGIWKGMIDITKYD